MPSQRGWIRPGRLPLLPVAPLVVVLVGVGIAAVMALFGLVQLRRTSDEGALEQAYALARVLAARVRVVAEEDRGAVVEELERRTGAELMLVNQQGEVLAATLLGPPEVPVVELLVERAGFVGTSTGRAAFAVQELEPPFAHMALVLFVHAPAAPAGSRALLKAVAALTAVLVSVAAVVAFVFSKDAHDDVEYVRRRIEAMAGAAAPLGEPIPLRTFDQVGVVTAAFNGLLERFAAADRAYRHDLRQAEAQEQARARFLATLSHELRTPLNAILGFADVLLSEVEGPLTASAREDLEVIRSSGDHLRSLIDDILDLSAMETGSLRLERRKVDVFRVAKQVVREAQALASRRRLSLVLEGEPGAEAWADSRRVRQILANLVSNAIKFTPEGQVRVQVGRGPGVVVVEVSDTGPGIPKARQEQLFQAFQRLGQEAGPIEGTGLGLAIARRLTHMHQGQISLQSRPGEGSTFRVELPDSEAVSDSRLEASESDSHDSYPSMQLPLGGLGGEPPGGA